MLRHVSTLLGVAVAVLSLTLSSYALLDSVSLAKAKSPRVDPMSGAETIAAWLPLPAGIADITECGVRQRQASAERSLTALEAANPALDYDAWFARLQLADATAVAALRCSPNDGDLWADYALILRQSVVPAEHVVRALELSESLSPATGSAVVTRAAVWWSLPDAAVSNANARSARDRDIELFVLQAEPKIVASVIRDASATITDEVKRIHERASKKRKEEVAYALRLATPEPTTVPNTGAAGGKAGSMENSLFDLLQRPKLD